jgi:hypothetical protein
MEARNVVRAFERTVLATHALIVEMPNDTGDGTFFISAGWATIGAARFHAMVASGSQVLQTARGGGAS